MHTCVCASEWSVEYCTYQTSLGGWCTVWLVGWGWGGALDLCWACIPPTVTVLGCCYSCVM